jgi:hypothetical protein
MQRALPKLSDHYHRIKIITVNPIGVVTTSVKPISLDLLQMTASSRAMAFESAIAVARER